MLSYGYFAIPLGSTCQKISMGFSSTLMLKNWSMHQSFIEQILLCKVALKLTNFIFTYKFMKVVFWVK